MFVTIPFANLEDLAIELTYAPIEAFVGALRLIETNLGSLTHALWEMGLYCWDERMGRGIGICKYQFSNIRSAFICFSFACDPILGTVHLGQLLTQQLSDEVTIFIQSFLNDIGK